MWPMGGVHNDTPRATHFERTAQLLTHIASFLCGSGLLQFMSACRRKDHSILSAVHQYLWSSNKLCQPVAQLSHELLRGPRCSGMGLAEWLVPLLIHKLEGM